MRRPLLAAAILLVVIIWIKLTVGEEDALTVALSGADPPYAGETVTMQGRICQINSENQQFQIKSITLIRQGEAPFTAQTQSLTIHCIKQYKCIIKTEENIEDLKIGNQVALTGMFMPFSHATNPGEFDSGDYYSSLGIFGSLRSAEILAVGEHYDRFGQAAYICRRALQQRVNRIFPEKQAGIMSALLLGNKSELDSEIKDLYRRNGILHILSISSLHISILGMSLYRGLRRIRVPTPAAALAGSGLLLFYGWMTGFSISAVRAIGMFLLRMLALLVRRTYDMLTALGVLAAGMVLYRPFYLLNGGFLLSFGAVLGVGVVYPNLSEQVKKPFSNEREPMWRSMLRKGLEQQREAILISLSITLATLPLQLLNYYEVPLLSTVVNLAVLPFVRPLVLAGMLALIPGLGLLSFMDRGILYYYEALCSLLDDLPLRTWNPGCPGLWQVCLYYALLAAALVGWKVLRKNSVEGKRCIWKTAGRLLPILPVLLFTLSGIRGNRVIFLDVGQGNGVLIHHATGETYLYDCGSSSRSFVGEFVLLPCLKYYGIRELDAIIISHPDSDHMNGAMELISKAAEERIAVGQVLLPDIAAERREEEFRKIRQTIEKANKSAEIPVRTLSAGEKWSLGEVNYFCLHPEAESRIENSNDYSLCLAAEFPKYQLLLMGDTGQETELTPAKNFAAIRKNKPVILQAAHHGSKYSTAEAFLDEVQPAAALLSAGADNSYGHPHMDTLERLEKRDIDIYCTIDCGAVVIREERKGIQLTLFGRKKDP